jgi:CHAD domain-containing protein
MRQLFVKISGKVTSVSDRLTSNYRPKDLHRLRIGIRRIRSLLKQVGNHNARHFRKTWGGFAAVTNQARDWDVFLKSARAMLSDTELEEFRSMFKPQVLASHEAVIEVLQSAQWQRHLAEWTQFLQQIDDRVTDGDKPQWSVERALAKARETCQLALTVGDDRAWHKFRIAVKNLRYIADASIHDPACDQQQLGDVIAACKILQTRLGRWHDTVVQLQMIREQVPDDEEQATAMKCRLADALEQKKHLLLSDIQGALAEQTLFAPPDVL